MVSIGTILFAQAWVQGRVPARSGNLIYVDLRLRLGPLIYHGTGPELSSRHLHLVVIVAVTGEPYPARSRSARGRWHGAGRGPSDLRRHCGGAAQVRR
jgi:hypothetical protein